MKKGDHRSGEIEILKEDLIFKNKYVEIFNDKVIFPSGTEGTYVRISSESNISVGVLPITEEGKMVLIKTFRHAVRGWGYEIPKGEALPQENYEVAAKRELEEETGLIPERLIYIGEFCESPAICSGKIKCYVAINCRYSGAVNTEDTEAISGSVELTAQEYLNCTDAEFTDAITQLAVYKYITGDT